MIIVNVEKAKEIGHEIRRKQRAEEFAPLDRVIAAQIPGTDFAEIEKERQGVREKYAVIQLQIDAASTSEEIRAALGAM